MARPRRIRKPNLIYHVTSYCHNYDKLLFNATFKSLLLTIIIQTQKKYRFELLDYQIMDDHLQLIIKTLEDEADISRIMQFLKSRCAQSFNKLNHRSGAFWNDRFRDVIIQSQPDPDGYLLAVHILFAKMSRNTSSSKKADTYEFVGTKSYLQPVSNLKVPIVTHSAVFLSLGRSQQQRAIRFHEIIISAFNR